MIDADHLDDSALAEYATALALGRTHNDTASAAHLDACPACRARADLLLHLTRPVFAGDLLPIADTPAPDLRFLTAVDALAVAGRLIIEFTDAVIASIRRPALYGALRGGLIGRYTQGPTGAGGTGVVVEILAADAARQWGQLRIAVDQPGLDLFDQSGNRVVVRIGAEHWSGHTDASGWVELGPVPLSALGQMRIEITPR